MTNPTIEVRSLDKHFGKLAAVSSLDLAVAPGEVYGLLGPNGAGKSTTVRCLLGFLNPTAGEVRVLGSQPREAHRRLGYVGGDVNLDRHLKVKELLTWYAELRGGVPWEKISSVCERLTLDPSRRIGELSTGNRRKVAITQAFMHDPEVLILDEPTAGLDPLLQRSVLEMVRERRAAGAAVLFSSHLLPEVENIADRVGILRLGELVREDTMSNLRAEARQRVELRFSQPVEAEAFAGVEGVSDAHAEGKTVHLVVSGAVAPLIQRLAALPIERMVTHDEDLEDIFFTYYQGSE